MGIRELAAVVALAGAVWGCGDPAGPDWDEVRRRADLAEQRWLANGPAQYRITEQRGCSCTAEETGPVTIDVDRAEDGTESVLAMTYVASGQPVTTHASAFHTVRGLFGVIRQAASDDVARLEVTFDAELGYPSQIILDPTASGYEDVLIYRITALAAR